MPFVHQLLQFVHQYNAKLYILIYSVFWLNCFSIAVTQETSLVWTILTFIFIKVRLVQHRWLCFEFRSNNYRNT